MDWARGRVLMSGPAAEGEQVDALRAQRSGRDGEEEDERVSKGYKVAGELSEMQVCAFNVRSG